MTFQTVIGKIKNTEDPKELAKTIWDFFLFQYETAVRDDIGVRCELDSYSAANESAKREWAKDDYNVGGFGPPEPYSSAVINNKKREADEAKRNLLEAKALLNFIRDRFIDKFIS